jgi:ribosomal-protein-alanine N-acetyltransferase
MKRIYETERLQLKILDEKDTDAVLDYFQRNKEFLEQWSPTKGDEFFTYKYQAEQLKSEFKSIKKGETIRFWFFDKQDKEFKRAIGSIGFTNIVRGPFQSCFLGYMTDQDEINKGYASEAIKKGIEIVFKELGLHRVEANIMPDNKRSLRVVEKLGFEKEGVSKRYLLINGKWEDHVHMVLLND